MAVNRMRAALAAPRKGETFELRSGLVYVVSMGSLIQRMTLTIATARSMPTKGEGLKLPLSTPSNMHCAEKNQFRKQSWQ